MKTKTRLSHPSRHYGFSVIELLAALVLATMLMIVVMGFLSVISQRRKALLENAPSRMWQQVLTRQIHTDLANARRYEFQPDRLRLMGFCAVDPRSSQLTGRPAEVSYDLVQVNSQTWLFRTETLLDSDTNDNQRRELVCRNVTRMKLERMGGTNEKKRFSGAIPQCCRITLWTPGGEEPVAELLHCR